MITEPDTAVWPAPRRRLATLVDTWSERAITS